MKKIPFDIFLEVAKILYSDKHDSETLKKIYDDGENSQQYRDIVDWLEVSTNDYKVTKPKYVGFGLRNLSAKQRFLKVTTGSSIEYDETPKLMKKKEKRKATNFVNGKLITNE